MKKKPTTPLYFSLYHHQKIKIKTKKLLSLLGIPFFFSSSSSSLTNHGLLLLVIHCTCLLLLLLLLLLLWLAWQCSHVKQRQRHFVEHLIYNSIIPASHPSSPVVRFFLPLMGMGMGMQTVSLLPARPAVLPAVFSSPRAPFCPAGRARRVVSLWRRRAGKAPEKLEMQDLANVASQSTVQRLTSSINPQILMLPPNSFIGSPFLWIGVGIGISAAFNTMATRLKRMAILKAFKEIMGPNSPQDGTFNTAAFAPGTPFPLPSASPSATTIPTPTSSAPGPSVPLDVPKTNVQAMQQHDTSSNTKGDKETEGHGTSPASN